MLDETRFPITEYQGKRMHCGVEIFDIVTGHYQVSDFDREAGKRFGHAPDIWTGSYITAILDFKGKTYKADMRWTPDAGNEFMIFHSDACGNVRSGKDVFSRSGLEIMSVNVFLSLVAEWAKEIKKGARK